MNKDSIKIFKALSDPTRINILKKLLKKKELSCSRLSSSIPLSQPALSHHFSKLIEAGIISHRKEGVSNFYSINTKHLRSMGISIEKILGVKGGKI